MANLSTYTDIIADIKDKFSKKSAGFGSDTDYSIRSWIWQFEADIYSERKWPFLRKTGTITTAAATTDGEYSLAADYDFGKLYNVVDLTNLNPLHLVIDEDFDNIFPGGTETGYPLWYRLWGIDEDGYQLIQFYPIPAGIYSISYKYYRDPTPVDIETNMDNDGESPPLPRKYRRGLVDAILEELLQKDANPNADRVNVKYQNLINKMKADYAFEPAWRTSLQSTDNRYNETLFPRWPNNYPRD
jgi:hypothetical protein